MSQEQRRHIVARFEGKEEELTGEKSLSQEVGSFARSQGLQSFNVSVSTEKEMLEKVSRTKLDELQSEMQEVRLYRTEHAG